MHRALQVPELRSRITAYVRPMNDAPLCSISHREHDHGCQDLARLALTCKSFAWPALDALWHTMYQLTPLLKILQNSFKYSEGRVSVNLESHYTSAEEWRIFCSYARRIRGLAICLDEEEIDDDVFHRLEFYLMGEPLLPSLRSLYLVLNQAQLGRKLLSFISPRLVRVDIAVHPTISLGELTTMQGTDLGIFFRDLLCRAESLQELFYSGILPSHSMQPFENGLQLKRLYLLECDEGEISVRFLQCCAQLPRLSHLGIVIESEELAHCAGFPALEELYISSPVSELEMFMRGLTTTHMHTLDCAYHDETLDGLPRYTGFFQVLGSRYSTLRCLTVRFPPIEWDSPQQLRDTLYPLFNLHQLEKLELASSEDDDRAFTVSITSSDLHDMASAWPEIAELTICGSPSDIQPSVYDLTAFALHCPQLEHLKLPTLDVVTPASPGLEKLLLSLEPQHLLMDLEFVDDPSPRQQRCVCPNEVAYFLNRLFYDVELSTESTGYWKEVVDMLGQARRETNGVDEDNDGLDS